MIQRRGNEEIREPHHRSILARLWRTYRHFDNYMLRIRDALGLLPRREILYELRSGLKFHARSRSSDGHVILEITRDREYYQVFSVKPGDYVVDIGAHIGAFSAYAAYMNPGARVYAYEPIRENYELLRKNIEINQLDNVVAFNKAVSNESCRRRCYRGRERSLAASSLYEGLNEHVDGSFEIVDCIPFSEVMVDLPRCDFLKLDCEGAEFSFLIDCPGEVLEKVRKIAMEYHDMDENRNHRRLEAKLRAEGFRTLLGRQIADRQGYLFAWREA